MNVDMERVQSMLGKFGLDFITKIGQQNLKINILDSKVEEMNKAVIDIKALLPQLHNVIDNQKIIEEDLDLIKRMLQGLKEVTSGSNKQESCVERDVSITENIKSFLEKLRFLKNKIDTINNINDVSKSLQNIKDEIFEATGGHRILYEISQAINKLKNEDILTEHVKKDIKEKIDFWINKL